ncbi:MAG TPA: aminomethyl-transferring glycine dehydrogenase [Verrucomicrobiae bacterium]|nr:aminomethyl-transferring glycine dehydrogenase [Verrucomicrobiae bacterium]
MTDSRYSAANALPWTDRFPSRHIGPDAEDIAAMLKTCGFPSLDAMIDAAVPKNIRLAQPLNLPAARSEYGALAELRAIAAQNKVFRSFIGMGYHDCVTPGVIQRNILENPGWYTQYTPYQAEISQGRLEALLNFQTMVADLTGMQIANASLLDEGTAAAEAMAMAHGLKGSESRNTIFISDTCHPQTIEVVRTRAAAIGVQVVVGNHHTLRFPAESAPFFAVLLQYPATDGNLHDYRAFVEQAHVAGALVIVATDLLALTLLAPPGDWGADIVVGNSQRFGVPLGYGGPHAAFFATRDEFKRSMPGRLVGVSKDAQGRPALRLALQTREQHIRREKATSNICTAQVLLAAIASMYAVYHGPEGLKNIARRVHRITSLLAAALGKLGVEVVTEDFFDTLKINLGQGHAGDLVKLAEEHFINVRVFDAQSVGVSLDETTGAEDLETLIRIFNHGKAPPFTVANLSRSAEPEFPTPFARTTPFLAHPTFNRHHSETEMLRYIRRLESRDLSLTASMIPLGSCTMKLNASAEMLPLTWPEFGRLHPFAPTWQAEGYKRLFKDLEGWLAEITGFAATSLQPNAGSTGEFAGLLVVRAWHESRGQSARRVCLIPTSAHGTNPASAVMAGMKVVPVACDSQGNIDLADLTAKAARHKDDLSCLMVTYPSTHGVFEETIRNMCEIIHAHGGQVYMDGANMNAQVGLTSPGAIGADVCHLNLHKTFCIPHGGGGPGVGPICVAKHLAPFLPGHPLVTTGGAQGIGPVAAAPWGSASILVISWMYIRLMGPDGLREASKVAILNANYIAARLSRHFPTLYKGPSGLVAHECIVDLRAFKSTTAEDVAKRLIDYGFHAPTLSWPVAGTLMVEPTESEARCELDRFCDAMISIHGEMSSIESGAVDKLNNPLKNAPHTAEVVCADQWDRPYSREQAAFPVKGLRQWKFWPPVSRVDNVFGDRNPVCSCVGMG